MNNSANASPSSYWLNHLPDEWGVTRLANVADILFSNVDKHTIKGEVPVRLCNYVDVYKNSRIMNDIEFMDASADAREIERFQIMVGDVLATKDSETPDDIAISALVTENLPGVLCGYHLALIRPRKHLIYGPYLAWLHGCKLFRSQYEANAVGVTRFGLSQADFKEARIPLPTLNEQRRIAAYLDKTCAAIDTAIEKKQKQLETLNALRKSIIHKAVTCGLDDSVELKESGIAWAPLKPAHWKTCRVKDILDFFNTVRIPLSADIRGLMTDRIYDYYGASGVIDKVEGYLFDGTYILIAEDGANLLARNSPLAFLATGKFWVNNHAHILKPRFDNIRYFVYLLESLDYSLYITGAAQPKLTKENLGKYKIIVPPKTEQDLITDYLEAKTAELKKLNENIENQIAALQQYRKSLIHECVTGKGRIGADDV
jgi:type I restriction enzyme, S subunit